MTHSVISYGLTRQLVPSAAFASIVKRALGFPLAQEEAGKKEDAIKTFKASLRQVPEDDRGKPGPLDSERQVQDSGDTGRGEGLRGDVDSVTINAIPIPVTLGGAKD